MDKYKYVSVEFPDDPNVVGRTYWYRCVFDQVRAGSVVVAPLGRHNNLQQGVVRSVFYCDEKTAPYPVDLVKEIDKFVR